MTSESADDPGCFTQAVSARASGRWITSRSAGARRRYLRASLAAGLGGVQLAHGVAGEVGNRVAMFDGNCLPILRLRGTPRAVDIGLNARFGLFVQALEEFPELWKVRLDVFHEP